MFVLDEFSYHHSWVAAHFATMARSFLDNGFLPLGLVPVQNSGPLTEEPDYYLHWPPFFAIFQAWIFALFNTTSIFAVHAIATTLVLAQAALAAFWVRRVLSPLAAFATVVVFLNLPIVAKFDHVGLYLHLALLLVLAAVLIHDHAARREAVPRGLVLVGAGCFALACFTSWEPILALPGLAVYWVLDRTWRKFRLLAGYAASGLAAVSATPLLYVLQSPEALAALVNRALYRAGLSNSVVPSVRALHLVEGQAFDVHQHDFGYLAARHLTGILVNHLPQLGVIGVLSLAATGLIYGFRRNAPWPLRGPILVLVPLLSMGVLWMLVMPQHFYIHQFQVLLFAIPTALAAGFAAEANRSRLVVAEAGRSGHTTQPKALLLLLVAIAIVGRLEVDITKYLAFDRQAPLVEIGKTLRLNVPEDALVAVPWKTAVPTYYSDRHLIRGVESHEVFVQYAGQIDRLCAECPLYLVLPAEQAIPDDAYPVIWENDHWRLVLIREAISE